MQNITAAVSWTAPGICQPQADLELATRAGEDFFGWTNSTRAQAAMSFRTFEALRARLCEQDPALPTSARPYELSSYLVCRFVNEGIPPEVVIDDTLPSGKVRVTNPESDHDIWLNVD
jgi:hypothetical protein